MIKNELGEVKDFKFSSGMVGNTFNSHVNEQLPFYELVTRVTSSIIRNYLPKDGVLYDIGASTGNVTRSVADIGASRNARFISIESSEEMGKTWDGYGELHIEDAVHYNYEKFDVAVCFLVIMFMTIEERKIFIDKLKKKMNRGGIIIIVDKVLADGGYFGTVLRRLTFDWKLKNGASPQDIIKKELSLSGVQRPMYRSELEGSKEFFRLGEFIGVVIENEVS
jgi:tRNA (cmo5U34)-methyltransferase